MVEEDNSSWKLSSDLYTIKVAMQTPLHKHFHAHTKSTNRNKTKFRGHNPRTISIEIYVPASLVDGMVYTRNRKAIWGVCRDFAFLIYEKIVEKEALSFPCLHLGHHLLIVLESSGALLSLWGNWEPRLICFKRKQWDLYASCETLL